MSRFVRTERLRVMKYQHFLRSSSGGPSGPTLVMDGNRARSPAKRPIKKEPYDLFNLGSREPLPSETVRLHTKVVSEAGAVARKSVHRGVGVLVVSASCIHTICDGSN